MDLPRIAIRCLFTFFFLFAAVRLSKKRFVSEATAFDFVLGLIIGDLVDDAIFGEVPLSKFVMAAGVLVLMEITACFVAHKNDRWLWFLEGKPRVILQSGRLNRQVMKTGLIGEQEVCALLRLEGIEKGKWDQVKLGSVEASGDLSVLKEALKQDAKKKDKNKL